MMTAMVQCIYRRCQMQKGFVRRASHAGAEVHPTCQGPILESSDYDGVGGMTNRGGYKKVRTHSSLSDSNSANRRLSCLRRSKSQLIRQRPRGPPSRTKKTYEFSFESALRLSLHWRRSRVIAAHASVSGRRTSLNIPSSSSLNAYFRGNVRVAPLIKAEVCLMRSPRT